MRRAALGLVVLLVACGCDSRGGDRDRASEAVTGFLAAVERGDGTAACALLSQSTASKLAEDERSPCAEAVTGLKLNASRPVATDLYMSAAQVHLADGESAFLDETPAGWKISAAGCVPEPGEEQPDTCEIED